MSDIDTEFEEAANKINEHLKVAAEALKEANRLAKAAGLEGLIFTNYTAEYLKEEEREELRMKYHNLETGELELQMDNAGWSSSSSYC